MMWLLKVGKETFHRVLLFGTPSMKCDGGGQSQVNLWTEDQEDSEQPQHREQQQQRKKLKNRIVFGSGIGAAFLGIVLAGGWVFTLAFSWAIWVATGEYFELVRSKGNVASGMIPPPPVAAKVCAAICSLMPIMTLYVPFDQNSPQ